MVSTLNNGECPPAATHILIADDHAMVREGLRRILDGEADLAVVATVDCGEGALAELANGGIDLLLLDVSMPGISGPALVRSIHHQYPDLAILAVSMHDNRNVAAAMLDAGVRGFITKDSDPEQLLEAIRAVVAGRTWVHSALRMSDSRRRELPIKLLSKREEQVLLMLAEGLKNNQIAERLFISEKTVSTHKSNIMMKLEATSIADLIRCADQYQLTLDRGSPPESSSD